MSDPFQGNSGPGGPLPTEAAEQRARKVKLRAREVDALWAAYRCDHGGGLYRTRAGVWFISEGRCTAAASNLLRLGLIGLVPGATCYVPGYDKKHPCTLWGTTATGKAWLRLNGLGEIPQPAGTP